MDLKIKPFYLTQEEENWVYSTLNSMTQEEKAGQLFCVMAQSYSEDELDTLVEQYGVGGVLFRPTYTTHALRQRLTALNAKAKIPLLKAANLEEGGNGAVSDGTRFAAQMGVAAAGNPDMVIKFAHCCASEGAAADINWTFSPVADIDMNFRNPIINVRSFGSQPEKVENYCKTYTSVLQSAGIAACAKHFPGDGVDGRDQHLHPTYNTLEANEWYATYGAVYRALIEDGILSIMAGHIAQPAVQKRRNPALTDAEILPASLSPELLQGVLREEFGFHGVIISDATIMGGFCMAMPREQAIPAGIMAGCDMFCFSTDIYEDIQFVLQGLQRGALTQDRLDEAVLRILALKAVTARTRSAQLPPPIAEWAEECADQMVTLVKDTKGILPIKKEKYDKIRLIALGTDQTQDGSLKAMVRRRLEQEGFAVEDDYAPFQDNLTATEKLDRKRLTIYICNMEARSNNTAVRLYWCPKHAIDGPRNPHELDYIFISFANPYHLYDVPRIPVYINAYTATQRIVNAVIDKLFGQSRFTGASPVDPFCGLPDARL